MISRDKCIGCRNDHYNLPGNSMSGRCWSAEDAKVIKRYAIGTWTLPTQPGAFAEVMKPSCYHRTGEHYVNSLPSSARDVVRLVRK